MKFNDLRQMVIRNPFTVEKLFNECFYVSFTTGNTKENLESDFYINGNSISLYDLKERSFCFENCDAEFFESFKNVIEELFIEEKTVIIATIGYQPDNPFGEQILEDKNQRVFISAYIVELMKTFLARYDIQLNWAVFHEQQTDGEDVENNHFHLLLSCNKFNEKFDNFVEDLKGNIFDR